ncbi:hypothetical protein L9F63_014245, partial [Diploptera punctata]
MESQSFESVYVKQEVCLPEDNSAEEDADCDLEENDEFLSETNVGEFIKTELKIEDTKILEIDDINVKNTEEGSVSGYEDFHDSDLNLAEKKTTILTGTILFILKRSLISVIIALKHSQKNLSRVNFVTNRFQTNLHLLSTNKFTQLRNLLPCLNLSTLVSPDYFCMEGRIPKHVKNHYLCFSSPCNIYPRENPDKLFLFLISLKWRMFLGEKHNINCMS